MKALVSCLILIFAWCDLAGAQPTRTGNIPPAFLGSVVQGPATGTVIPLSISDAIDRALKYNLGTIISDQETRVARASRLRALSELLPKVNGGVTETVQQINFAAFGFGGLTGTPPVVGPFSVFNMRARYSQSLFDFRLLHELRSESEKVKANSYSQDDAREIVVLIATDLYLEAIAGSSRVESARAQLRTAQAVYDRATSLKESGVLPGIDVLRAQVQLHAQQQRVLASENDLAKAKLNLARAIGLPQGQPFTQTDAFATAAVAASDFNQLLSSALEARPDYGRAMALVRAAEESRKAALGRGRPAVQFNVDYGDIGRTPGRSHGTVVAEASLLIPLYTGERVRAETMESEALLEERKAEAADLRNRIEYEIRTASLDIQSALEQVKVAQSAKDLAQQQLIQAEDRFAAGVANGLEVVQAQDAIATADENYISSLFSLNVAQASLARAIGTAEKTIKAFFGGR
jgi:outer membrane protein TolC